MKSIADLSTRSKLFFAFGLMFAFLLAVTGSAYQGIVSVRASQKAIYEHSFADAVDMQDIQIVQQANQIRQLKMMVIADKTVRQDLHADMQKSTAENAERIKRMARRNQGNPKIANLLDEFALVDELYNKTREQDVIPLILGGHLEQAAAMTAGGQFDRFEFMQDMAHNLIRTSLGATADEVAAADRKADLALAVFLVVGVAALLTGGVLALMLTRMLSEPLRELAGRAQRIARGEFVMATRARARRDEIGQLETQFNDMVHSLQEKADLAGRIATGDLTAHAVPQSEHDVLGQAFAAMTDKLRAMARGIGEGVAVLAASSSDILSGTTQLAANAGETAASLTETSSTVEEIKQTSLVTSQHARNVAQAAEGAVLVSAAGRKSLDELVEGMGQIRAQMEQVTGSIVRLSEQSQAIGEIINTVNSLAEQSNLLAVNASIEAAKAGEQGRGFAVVATEVRSLAEQSRQATVQVRTILSDIQKATGRAVLATELGSKAVAAGSRQLREADEAIRQLGVSIDDNANAAKLINASAQQQLTGIEQLRLTMNNIKEASEQNGRSTRQAERAAHDLHGLGQQLKQLVEQYKL